MLKNLGFKQPWAPPLDLLRIIETPKPVSDDDETLYSSTSAKSISSWSSGRVPVKEQLVYPAQELQSLGWIRLLKIHEAFSPEHRIECSLQNFSLAEKPSYCVLSYTWGPAIRVDSPGNVSPFAGEDQQILCNDLPFLVTENLQDALQQLRRSRYLGWLWVDAVCINQSNAEERALQAARMGQICQSALETILWLGKDESGAEEMQWGIDYITPRVLQLGPTFWSSQQLTDPKLKSVFGVEDFDRSLFGIKNLLSTRRWFSRPWVVPEVALAPVICVRIGKRHFSWTDLANLSIVLVGILGDQGPGAKPSDLDQRFYAASRFIERLQRLRSLMPRTTAGHEIGPSLELSEAYRTLQTQYGAETELEMAAAWTTYLLFQIQNSGSSERHDRIYAILSLARSFSSKVDELVTIDYRQSTARAYRSLTEALLLNSRYLNTLTHVGDISNHQIADPPSWTVDYSSPKMTTPILDFSPAVQFDASRASETSPFARKIEQTRLILAGAQFEQITAVLPAPADEVIKEVAHFEEFMNFASRLPDQYLNGQSRTEVLWRVMMMDSDEIERRGTDGVDVPTSSAKGFQAWLIHMIGQWVITSMHQRGVEPETANESARQFFTRLYPTTGIEVPKKYQADDDTFTSYHGTLMLPFIRSALERLQGRKLFQTSTGLVGLGPSSLRTSCNDQVWLIRDSRTPLVLRPNRGTRKKQSQQQQKQESKDKIPNTTLEPEESESDTFLLVGEAYLHGFMHGEMLAAPYKLEERIGPVSIL